MKQLLFQGQQTEKVLDLCLYPKMRAVVAPQVIIETTSNHWGDIETHVGFLLQCSPLQLLEDQDANAPSFVLTPFEVKGTLKRRADPIRWWRALLLLEAIPVLDETLFPFYIFHATSRCKRKSNHDHKVINTVQTALAEGYEYDEIMSRLVPAPILQLVIDIADEEKQCKRTPPPPLIERHTVSHEIEAGTVQWSPALKRIGVKHPLYIRAVREARTRIVTQYEVFLGTYADAKNYHYHPRNSYQSAFLMIDIETRLCDLIERGIEHDHGKAITIMLAILLSEIGIDQIEASTQGNSRRFRSRPLFVPPEPETHFQEVIDWFLQNFRGITGGTDSREYQSLNDTLHHLYALDLMGLPIRHQLVPEYEG